MDKYEIFARIWYWYFFLIVIINGGLNIMDSGVLAALISAVALGVIDLIANIRGDRNTVKLGKSSSGKTLISMLGNDSGDEISLSGQHKEITLNINEKYLAISKEINDIKSVLEDLLLKQKELKNMLERVEFEQSKAYYKKDEYNFEVREILSSKDFSAGQSNFE